MSRKKYQRTVLTYEGIGKQPNQWINMQKNAKQSVNYLINLFIKNRGMVDPITQNKPVTKPVKPQQQQHNHHDTPHQDDHDNDHNIMTDFRNKL